MNSQSPRSICLLRLSALGDVCHCIALVRALQRQFPDTSITWIVGRSEFRLVQAMPEIECIVFDKRSGLKGFRALHRQLSGRRFDVLLHAQVSTRANLLGRMIAAKRRIGFDRARSREGHGWVINERIAAQPFQHQADAMLEFARVLGVELDLGDIDRTPPILDEDRDFAAEHQPESNQAVLISPCSSHPARNWTISGYAQVADWIIEQTDRPVILIGGPSEIERQTAAEIESEMRQQPINLVGKDTLGQALAMLERAACLIAPDSGPLHFADALGTPVVGLYASTWSRRSGPYSSLGYCVDRFPQAAEQFCGKSAEQLRWGARIEKPGVMDLIQYEDVVAKLRLIL